MLIEGGGHRGGRWAVTKTVWEWRDQQKQRDAIKFKMEIHNLKSCDNQNFYDDGNMNESFAAGGAAVIPETACGR